MDFPDCSVVKNHLPRQEARVQSLGGEDALEEEMANHFSILAWEIPWTEEPGGLQSMGPHDLANEQQQQWILILLLSQ